MFGAPSCVVSIDVMLVDYVWCVVLGTLVGVVNDAGDQCPSLRE